MGNFRAIVIAALVAPVAGAWSAPTQNFPSKPIRIVLPGIAGSPGDVRARQVAQKLSETLGQPVVVDNRPGANGAISARQAAKAAPDGYTLLSCNVNHVLNDLLNPDPVSRLNHELVPITRLTSGPLILAVHPSVPAASLKEFIDLAKSRPGSLSHATGGQGSLSHLLAELIKSKTGVDIKGIPYKSTSAEIPDVLGGHINATFNYFQIIGPHFGSGRLRALAVADATRLPVAPEIATMSEAGLPGVEATGWNGICAPAGVPKPVISLLHRELVDALKDPAIRNQMISTGATVGGDRPDEFAAYIRAELAKWGRVINDARISLQ
ncbi:MAG TPA: tripartite tricarboxylate transporter substrate-binding protein [Burkholderiales bacterium]|nr:tripartite tricarboxylate transporter substrate-binding protein [Burkholderiales bacterium]